MKVADSDADGLASPSIRQRPHTDAEEQLHGVLGDRGGETKGSSELFAEVSGGDYLGHHRWVVFLFRRSTALRGRAEICPVDGNTRSAYRIPNGESRVLRPPPRKRPNSPTSPSACACRHAADGLAKPRAQGSGASEALHNLDAKTQEMIAVEVDWIGTMMPSPRNPRQAATLTERALGGQVDWIRPSESPFYDNAT